MKYNTIVITFNMITFQDEIQHCCHHIPYDHIINIFRSLSLTHTHTLHTKNKNNHSQHSLMIAIVIHQMRHVVRKKQKLPLSRLTATQAPKYLHTNTTHMLHYIFHCLKNNNTKIHTLTYTCNNDTLHKLHSFKINCYTVHHTSIPITTYNTQHNTQHLQYYLLSMTST